MPPRRRCCSSWAHTVATGLDLPSEAADGTAVRGRQRPLLPEHPMAACKPMTDAAAGVPGSTMVTVMARNGVNFGVQLSGTGRNGSRPPRIRGLMDCIFRAGRGTLRPISASPDHRDHRSRWLRHGRISGDRVTRRRHTGRRNGPTAAGCLITLGTNPALTLPLLNFGGTPAVGSTPDWWSTRVLPIINTGIARRRESGRSVRGSPRRRCSASTKPLAALAEGPGK